jgi:hypothetical protein
LSDLCGANSILKTAVSAVCYVPSTHEKQRFLSVGFCPELLRTPIVALCYFVLALWSALFFWKALRTVLDCLQPPNNHLNKILPCYYYYLFCPNLYFVYISQIMFSTSGRQRVCVFAYARPVIWHKHCALDIKSWLKNLQITLHFANILYVTRVANSIRQWRHLISDIRERTTEMLVYISWELSPFHLNCLRFCYINSLKYQYSNNRHC